MQLGFLHIDSDGDRRIVPNITSADIECIIAMRLKCPLPFKTVKVQRNGIS